MLEAMGGTIYGNSNPWIDRIAAAERAKKAWEEKFRCRRLNDYYENFQWKARTDGPQLNYNPYTLNMFYSTIKIKMASFLFQKPKFNVTPEPGHSHWDIEFAVESAQLKQDCLNTIVKNRNIHFAKHLKYAALDAFTRFGIIEVGYAADWRNPQKEDPLLNSWENPDYTGEESRLKVVDDNELPQSEWFYIKRIKADRFVVSVSDAEELEDHQWVGYWQYYYLDTLKKTKGINIPDNYSGSAYSMDDIGSYSKDRQTNLYLPSSLNANPLCKVWHIWDLVAKKRRLILDGWTGEDYELWNDTIERLPLVDLRWELRLDGFYPIPPAWYWLSSQDEINEAREQIRSYRRRFTRKFQAIRGAVDPEEMEKFVSGPDGVTIEVKSMDAIKPIDNPEIGPTSENALVQAKDDFNLISGTSAEARGQDADRATATASKIIDARSQVRESVDQLDFSVFASAIGRELLCQAQEKMTLGMWIKYTSDPSQSGMMQDMTPNSPYYKFIKAQDLNDGYDFDVDVDVVNATPVAQQTEQTSFVNFVTFIQQFPMLALSPVLIRETAYRFGYKNEQVIHQMQQAAILQQQLQQQQLLAQKNGAANSNAAGGGGSNPADTAKAQMATPSPGTIQQQINNQLGPVQ
jgi:hypothetical protein